MRCVLDTNVLVSALLFPASTAREALRSARSRGTILLSRPAFLELAEVLRRTKFRRYFEEEDVLDFLSALARDSEWIAVDTSIAVCRDPKDDKFLSLALSGGATHIVSGDSDLLVLHPFRGISIMSPRDFVELHSPSR